MTKMKKQYIQPATKAVKIEMFSILAGSPKVDTENYDGSEQEFPDGTVGNGDEDEAG